MAKLRIIMGFAFLCAMVTPCEANCSKQRSKDTMSDFYGTIQAQILIRDTWEDVRIKLVRLPTQTVQEIEAKRAVFDVRTERRTIKIAVVAIIAPKTGNSWIGPEQAGYIETDTGIVGFRVIGSGLMWQEGLISGTQGVARQTSSMSQLLESFERDVTGSELFEAAFADEPEKRKARTISLKPAIKNPWMFTNGKGSSQPGRPKVLDVDAGGKDTFKLTLTDQTEEFHAKIWMNVKARRMTKVEEGPWDYNPKPFVRPK